MASQKNDSQATTSDSKRIEKIFDAVIFCAKQSIYMEGQKKRPLYEYSDEEEDKEGNVQALINLFFSFSSNDYSQSKKSPKSPDNATFMSKKIMDQILETCRKMLTANLVEEVKKAQFFSIIAEKSLPDDDDIRVPLFVRFVDKNLKIREELLQYVARGMPNHEETCGELFSKNIVKVIGELGLRMEFCRGLNFDCCNQYGVSEAATKIQAAYEKAVYIQNRSDLLNVCVASTCKSRPFFMTIRNIQFTAKLFTEDKEITELLESKIKETMPKSEHSRLIELCHTSWGATVQQFDNFVELFPAIIAVYDEIRLGPRQKWIKDDSKRFTADGCSSMLEEFESIMCLIIVSSCLKLTQDLTEELQKICYDSRSISGKVSELHAKLDEFKSNIEEKHLAWYESAVALALKIDVAPRKAQSSLKSKQDPNPDESISDHYLKSITLPFLEHLKTQINLRFSEASIATFDGLAIMPSNVNSNPKTWKNAALRFLKKYEDDQSDFVGYYEAEVDLWEYFWKNRTPLPDTILQLLSHDRLKNSKQLAKAFKIYASMPITPLESPRVLPYVNEELDLYSMTDEYLNALALLSIRGKDLKTEEVIECYRKNYTLPLNLDDD